MKEFLRIEFDPVACRRELEAFRTLLGNQEELEENADIKPFFDEHQQLAVFLGSSSWAIAHYDLLAYQYELFGDYRCDLVVGDSIRKSFGFIEWEDASSRSLFRKQGRKATPEWSARFEHGFGQIIDWFCKLDDMTGTDEFESRFGDKHIHYIGLLVAGRDAWLSSTRERRRWEWRSRKVVVNSLPIHCMTYDQLYEFLNAKLNVIYPLSETPV